MDCIGTCEFTARRVCEVCNSFSFGKIYGRVYLSIERGRNMLVCLAIILIPMVLIVCQKETGSALVYLSFFLVLYREGMTGSILFAGVCAIIYFIVGIRFSNELMADGLTSLGEFAVLGLIILFSALLVKAYCKNSDRAVVYILSFGLGSMLLGMAFFALCHSV